MESAVEEIKKKLDIVEFIGSYTTIKKLGRNFKALCPFHNEKTASFVISPERQIWHCFGSCGDGGDVIKFLMKWENITFYEALKELAEKTGVVIKKVDFEDKQWHYKQRLLEINSLTAEYFEYLLHKSSFGQKAKDYLEERKIKTPIIKAFQLGYAPKSWDSLLTFLRKKKFQPEEISRAGLVVKNSKGTYYDRFRGRVMFPIRDVRGNILGFSGRLLDREANEVKYINTPETELYHKRETLYGIHLAKNFMKKNGVAILVEGEFDVISMHQSGAENAVAIKGSAVTKEQLLLLKRFVQKVYLALDMDAAGEEAIKRGIEEAEELEFDISIIKFENGKDPDEAVKANSVVFKKSLEKPIPIYDFMIEFAQNKYPQKDAYSKMKIGEEIVPFVERIKNSIVKSHYIKKIAQLLEVSEDSVLEVLRKTKVNKKTKNTAIVKKKTIFPHDRIEILQKFLLSMMFQNDEPYIIAQKIFGELTPEQFTIPSLQKISKVFLEYQKLNNEYSLESFIKTLPSELRTVFDEVYLLGSSEWNFSESKEDRLILEVKKLILKKKLSELIQVEGENVNKEEEMLTITRTLKEVEKRIAAV